MAPLQQSGAHARTLGRLDLEVWVLCFGFKVPLSQPTPLDPNRFGMTQTVLGSKAVVVSNAANKLWGLFLFLRGEKASESLPQMLADLRQTCGWGQREPKKSGGEGLAQLAPLAPLGGCKWGKWGKQRNKSVCSPRLQALHCCLAVVCDSWV